MNANEILTTAAATLEQRGKDYDQPEGERSMGRIVETFNALTGNMLTEAQGWQFMACLKLVRMSSAADPTDSAIDCAAYAALAGEAFVEGTAIEWYLDNREREAAAPEPSQQEENKASKKSDPDATDYFSLLWFGGDCPVDGETMVEFKTRDGIQEVGKAKYLNWKMEKGPKDIISYRVVKEKAHDADDWILWEGGECPVDEDADVQYRLRNGEEAFEAAGLLEWEHHGEGYDITAYRVVEE